MKTFKTIVLVYLIAFHLAVLSVTAFINFSKSDFGILLKFLDYMNLFFYLSLLGVIILLAYLYLYFRLEKSIENLKVKHENEVNQLKAKLYDKKESEGASKPAIPVQHEPTESKGEKSDSTETDYPTDQA